MISYAKDVEERLVRLVNDIFDGSKVPAQVLKHWRNELNKSQRENLDPEYCATIICLKEAEQDIMLKRNELSNLESVAIKARNKLKTFLRNERQNEDVC